MSIRTMSVVAAALTSSASLWGAAKPGTPVSDAEKNNSTAMNAAAYSADAKRADGFRILFIGNSITLHGSLPSIGWTNVWGMAASAKEKDYVHLVTRELERRFGRKADLTVRNLADFERGFRTYDFAKAAELAKIDPDVLVIALGENVSALPTEKDRLAYRDAFKKLLGAFLDGRRTKPLAVVRGVFWPNADKDWAMAYAASDYAIPFVKADFASKPGMDARDAGFTHAGVRAHPGDRGMAEIAARILEGLLPEKTDFTVPSPSAPAYLRAAPPGTPTKSRLWQGISPKVKAWEMGGRAETLKWFEEHQFGRTPARAHEIAAKETQFEKSAVVFPKAKLRINIFCARPKGADAQHPVPVFLFMDHRGGETLDRPQKEYANIPTNAITARGYAYVRWNGNDLCHNTDRWHGLGHWPVGIVSYVATGDAAATNVTRAADGWGTIGAWAWGSSRVLDWIERQPELDATRVCVIGHSRGGKTALWTAAQDERFAMAISSGSGCGGAGLARERIRNPKAEKIGDILKNFPNWFCPAHHEWIGRDAEVPHDADDLIRLIAPRLVYVVSGSEDFWAGPKTEKAAWDAAHDLYGAYGLADRMGYYCHDGGHFLRPDDWEQVMNLADRALKVPSSADSDEIDRRLAAAVADGSRTMTLGRNPAAKDGVWRLVRAILVPDDFTLVFDGCRVELADRVQDNIIRNAGAADGDAVAKPNKGIRILGRNGAKLSAGERNHYRPRRSGDPNGWRAFGILLRDVSDYEIGGLAFGETQCWAITQERCHHGRVHDLVFGSTDRFYNQDGIDVRKGCHDLLIENISGSTGDDAVALTALRADASCGEADDIYNVTVRNVRAKSAGGHGVIRLLNADGIRMHHIVVSNVVDTASGSDKRSQATIRIGDANFSTIRRCKMGEMHHVTVRDVKASGPLAVWIHGPLADSSVTDITPIPGGRRYDITAPLDRVALDK